MGDHSEMDGEARAKAPAGWTIERIAAQYHTEIRALFEAENATWRAETANDVDKLQRECPEVWKSFTARAPDLTATQDSYLWEIFSRATIQIDDSDVRIEIPPGWRVYQDVIEMFEKPSVVWTSTGVGAAVIDGAPRVVINLTLTDDWNDAKAAAATAAEAAAVAHSDVADDALTYAEQVRTIVGTALMGELPADLVSNEMCRRLADRIIEELSGHVRIPIARVQQIVASAFEAGLEYGEGWLDVPPDSEAAAAEYIRNAVAELKARWTTHHI